MTISDRIFELIDKRGISQKEFSEATGIAQSSISDWKRKRTNPASDKILLICSVLDVSPFELLSGTESEGKRGNSSDFIVIDKNSELGQFILDIQRMDSNMRNRLFGYCRALKDMEESGI